jgi:hypothetical protein
VRQAISEGRRAYVLVNNRVEGNAPLTVEGLVGDIARLSRLEKEWCGCLLNSRVSPPHVTKGPSGQAKDATVILFILAPSDLLHRVYYSDGANTHCCDTH